MTNYIVIVLAIITAKLIWNIVVCPIAEKVYDFVHNVNEIVNDKEEMKAKHKKKNGQETIGFKTDSERG